MDNEELIAHIEGALINSEGKDFKVSADFVRDELLPAIYALSAEQPAEPVAEMPLARAVRLARGSQEPPPFPLMFAAPPEREGFVRVPVETTRDMQFAGVEAAQDDDNNKQSWGEYVYRIYAAMLAASPNAQEKGDCNCEPNSACDNPDCPRCKPAESVPTDIATAYTKAAQDSLTWCGAASADSAPPAAAPVEGWAKLIDRLGNAYSFECDGGPLKMCSEWIELKAILAAITPLEGK